MAQYARDLPVDKNNNAYITATPAYISNQSWSGVPVTSSTIGLSDRTTVVQLAATGNPVNFKWGPASVTSSSFDGTVVPGTTQTFVVPVSIMAAANSVMGANGANGLYNKISIFAPIGSASIFGAEF